MAIGGEKSLTLTTFPTRRSSSGSISQSHKLNSRRYIRCALVPAGRPNVFDIEDLIKMDRQLTDLHSRPAGWADSLRSVVSLGFTRRPWDMQSGTQSLDEMLD